jgi:hypothetical protein
MQFLHDQNQILIEDCALVLVQLFWFPSTKKAPDILHLSQQWQWRHFAGGAFHDHIWQPDVHDLVCSSHSSMFRLLQQLSLESSPVLSLRPKQE